MKYFLRTALVIIVVFMTHRLATATEIQKVISPAGIEVWLIEDHTVPIISLSFGFEGGAAVDPKGKEGVAMLASGLMDEGAGNIDSKAFQQKIADLGLDYSFDASADRFSGAVRMLTENKNQAADLIALALTQPRFDQEPVERMRRHFLITIEGEDRDPSSAAYRLLEKKLMGEHPYATSNYGSKESMTGLTTSDLRQFMKDRISLDHLFVAVAGDINIIDLGKLVDRAFGGLPKKGKPIDLPEAKIADVGSLSVLTRDIPQASVLFAQPAVKRNSKDFFAVYLMNYVLGGGGFSSRLMTEIREKRGLSYGISTDLVTLEHAGFLYGSYETPNAKVKETLTLLRAEWQRMAENGLSTKELDDAKAYMQGYYVRNLTTTSKAAETLLGIQTSRLGIDYIEQRQSQIDAVTIDDIKRVAKSLLNENILTIVVAGKPEGLESAQSYP